MGTLLTPADLATRLGKSADYWAREARAKRVAHHRIGRDIRFTEDDVAAIIAAAAVRVNDPLADAPPRAGRRRKS